MAGFYPNQESSYIDNPRVQKSTFIGREIERAEVPNYEDSKHLLPVPIWEGHEEVIACYDNAWQTAFGNLRKVNPYSGFVSNFIDTAFNGSLFMWDSTFITMFGRYGCRAFDFQHTLDNFYARQHRDGFICRTLSENSYGDAYSRFSPTATGPEVMEWSEWEYYKTTGNKQRLAEVFDPLLAYHEWMKENLTWRDGTYYSSGWGSGMDNQRRIMPEEARNIQRVYFSHGHMIWSDACFQEILSLRILIKMAVELGREEEIPVLQEELDLLLTAVNEKLWNEEDGYYYDQWRNGEHNHFKTIGAYWALLAEAVPKERLERFVAHLDNEAEFKRTHRVPTLSADHRMYYPDGWYWRGSIWSPTNYMVLKGLSNCGYDQMAHEIAVNHLDNVVKAFVKTGTLWENYSPEKEGEKGNIAKDNFVGWTGLSPISVLFEYVFGIKSIAKENKIIWDVKLLEKHGISKYPLGSGDVDLICEKREADEKPVITIQADFPVIVEVKWQGGTFILHN